MPSSKSIVLADQHKQPLVLHAVQAMMRCKSVVCGSASARERGLAFRKHSVPVLIQVWGPLIFESRRFVELRQKDLWQQITSAESTGLGLFYTLNIFCIQVSKSFS